ncbi:peroxidase 40 isoform X2 [Typha angustifolia]|uniref:peroxidase 40 isoform X2 n=1 Tax=Typha angustifolia TaxID=59011 RepID=UPI003C2BA327
MTCPQAEDIIFSRVEQAVAADPRMAASLLRLHFHDCFVNGCDASVLLDDTATFVGEKTAGPNLNSLRGFDVVESIKSELEEACPQTVSCADILAIVARDSVVLSGGPTWQVEVGRKDSRSASRQAANNNIPAPTSDVATLIQKFQNLGLSTKDMVLTPSVRLGAPPSPLGSAARATEAAASSSNPSSSSAPARTPRWRTSTSPRRRRSTTSTTSTCSPPRASCRPTRCSLPGPGMSVASSKPTPWTKCSSSATSRCR